ncbi:MAG: pyridoxamine 5'-phosphate oxidase family protein [Chloroflexota bacterium]
MPPGYGVDPAETGRLMDWSTADEWLRESRSYWVCSTRPDGRPHAAPVWGVWLRGAVWFGTERESRKARNIAVRPDIVIHLESGDKALIMEGRAEEADPANEDMTSVEDAYEAKYGFRPDMSSTGALTYWFRPYTVMAWLEEDFPNTATRWRLSPAI